MGLLAPKLGRGWLIPYVLLGVVGLYGALAVLEINPALPRTSLPLSTIVVAVLLALYGFLLHNRGEQFDQRRLELWTTRTFTRLFRLVLLLYAGATALVLVALWIGVPEHPALTVAESMFVTGSLSTAGALEWAAASRFVLDAVVFVFVAVGFRVGFEFDRRLWLLAGGVYETDIDAEPEYVGLWERYVAWRRGDN